MTRSRPGISPHRSLAFADYNCLLYDNIFALSSFVGRESEGGGKGNENPARGAGGLWEIEWGHWL